MSKIVIIGAGSVSFGPSILADLFNYPIHLKESEIWLVDTNPNALEAMARYAGQLNLALDVPFDIRYSTDRREALAGGAQFVIVSVAVDRIAAWKRDWQIPLQHGVRHVLGENGGPGGLSHALRTIPVLLEIAQDVERLAPGALLLNFSNPMSRVCLALRQHTRVPFVGLCHQIGEGYRLVNQVLKIVPERADDNETTRQIERRIHITAAGLNHFTFMLAVRDKLTGADLYPKLRAGLRAMPLSFELLSRRMLDVFGLFCASGDGHAGEYVGFAAETLPLSGYDFAKYEARGAAQWARVRAVAAGALAPTAAMLAPSGERAVPIMAAIANNLKQDELSVNLPNNGAIANLPDDAVVEVPGRVADGALRTVPVGALPDALASIMRREVDIQKLVVKAAVEGDRVAALQALMLDPHIHSYAQATHLLDALLDAQRALLPRFYA